ncbi:MAG: C4-dicarboxylate transporter DcuC [Polyangiales bacterium]
MMLLGVLVAACAVVLVIYRVEIRLVLIGAGFLMACLAGKPLAIVDKFAISMVAGMVAPICAAMGFAAVMRATACDTHLVRLLTAPLTALRWALVPAGILVAYVVNVAIPSQTSTAAALGPILVPLLLASGHTQLTAGAALVIGSSFGGDLLNPGAQDVLVIAAKAGVSATELSSRLAPASAAGVLVAAVLFAMLNLRRTQTALPVAAVDPNAPRIHLGKALIPLLPVALVFAAYGGVPALDWLIAPTQDPVAPEIAKQLPVVRAMLIGATVALVVSYRQAQPMTRAFFEGMGAAYANIISLTIAAQCFGAGLAALSIDRLLFSLAKQSHAVSLLSGAFPWALSVLTGSGSGPIQTFAETILTQVDAPHEATVLGAVACLGGALGRTMSPVAAVVVYSASLVGVSPRDLVQKLLPSLAAGAAVAFAVAVR